MIKERLESFKSKRIDVQYVELGVQQQADVIMDEFFLEVETIRENTEEIRIEVQEMQKIHSRLLFKPQTDQTKRQLEDIMADIKRIATKVRGKLKVMEQNINQLEETSELKSKILIRKSLYSNVSRKLLDVLTDYYSIQANYREMCKDAIKKELEFTNRSLSDDKLEEWLSKGNFVIFNLGKMTDEWTQNERAQAKCYNRINERYAEIINLDNSVRELNDMFMDMTSIIENRDLTGVGVQKSEEYSPKAKQKISRARNHKQKPKLKKILILGLLVVALIAGAVVVGCIGA